MALCGAATYSIVRSSTLESIDENLTAIAGSNTLAIDKWVAAKALAVKTTADEVEHGDPRGLVKHMGNANGFPITTIGWTDKTFLSTSTTTPKDYDPTVRPGTSRPSPPASSPSPSPTATCRPAFPTCSRRPLLRNGEATGALSGAVPLEDVRQVVAAVHPTPSSLAFVVARATARRSRTPTPVSILEAGHRGGSRAHAGAAGHAGRRQHAQGSSWPARWLLKAKAVSGTDWYL